MIIELSDYKSFCNITSNEYESIIKGIVEGCEKEVEEFLGYQLSEQEYIKEVNGSGCNKIVIDEANPHTLESIHEWNGSEWVEKNLQIDYTRSFIHRGTLHVEGMIFTKGFHNYRLHYTAGYDTIPSDIELALKRLVKLRWDETPMGKNSLGVSSITDNGGITSSTNIDKDDESKVFKTLEKHANTNV